MSDFTITSEMVKDLYKKLRETAKGSQFYRTLNAQKYRHISGYGNHQEFVLWASSALTAEKLIPSTTRQSRDYAMLGSQYLLKEAYKNLPMPCYWLNNALAEALINTSLPPNITDMKRVIEFGIIFLPNYFLDSPDGLPVKWLLFWHSLKGELNDDFDTLAIATSLGDLDLRYYSASNLERFDNENKLPSREEKLRVGGFAHADDVQSEREFLDKLNQIVCGALLYMQLYPEGLKEEASPPSTKGVGFSRQAREKVESLLNPIWIGKDYKPRTHNEKAAGTGTHSSPVTHWRRGHWRMQVCGTGREDRKPVWIQPVLVND